MTAAKKDIRALATLIKRAGDKLAEDKVLEEICISDLLCEQVKEMYDLLEWSDHYLIITNAKDGYRDIVIGGTKPSDFCSLYSAASDARNGFPMISEIEKRLYALFSKDVAAIEAADISVHGDISDFSEYVRYCVWRAGKVDDMNALLARVSGLGKAQFGTLLLNASPVPVPKNPTDDGDIAHYNDEDISIGDSVSGKHITWLKAGNLFICDRVILASVSWDRLNKQGLVFGEVVKIDGRKYLLRSLTDAEWDQMIDLYGEDNGTLHYERMYSWMQDEDKICKDSRLLRGYSGARDCYVYYATYINPNVGFRPALEIL